MSDLINRSKVISVLEQLEEHSLSGKMDISNAIYLLEKQPTAYDVGKVVEKLEEEKMSYFLTIANTGDEKLDCAYEHTGDALDKTIDIVKQEAEQYNNAIIDGNYCFQSCACTEKCDKCSRLCNGYIDWYENIDNWTEPYQLKGEIDE